MNNFVTEFDQEFNVIRNIQSEKIDISKNEWNILNPKIYQKNNYTIQSNLKFLTNFGLDKIQSLYSNLSALDFELYELRKNYKTKLFNNRCGPAIIKACILSNIFVTHCIVLIFNNAKHKTN